jgi:hypothetical protein
MNLTDFLACALYTLSSVAGTAWFFYTMRPQFFGIM